MSNKQPIEGVLIAGAGAVGLLTGLALAERDVPVTIIEAEAELVEEYRASTFHPSTLDALDEYELAVPLISAGTIASKVQYRDWEVGMIAEFDLSILSDLTRFPFRVQKDQYALSKMLVSRLSTLPGVDILFSHRLESAESDAYGVMATVLTSTGTTNLKAKYLVGADGANSTVRRTSKIKFEGKTYEDRYVTIFTSFPFERHLTDFGPVNYVADPVEWTVLLRSPEHWRVLYPANRQESDDEALSKRSIQGRLGAIVERDETFEVEHSRIYRVHQRVASKYRNHRILLVGDAAHVNNPVGGMGLNGGIQDAVSLGSTLADVWHKRSPESRLDVYADERRKVAIERVGKRTDQNARQLSEADPIARSVWRNEMYAKSMDTEKARRFLMEASLIT